MKKKVLGVVLCLLILSVSNALAQDDCCLGDFECDGNVDGSDAVLFKTDFGRRDCPTCATGE